MFLIVHNTNVRLQILIINGVQVNSMVAFLHAAVMAKVVMCRVQPSPPGSALGYGVLFQCLPIKKCLHIPFVYIKHSKDRLNTNRNLNVNTDSN